MRFEGLEPSNTFTQDLHFVVFASSCSNNFAIGASLLFPILHWLGATLFLKRKRKFVNSFLKTATESNGASGVRVCNKFVLKVNPKPKRVDQTLPHRVTFGIAGMADIS